MDIQEYFGKCLEIASNPENYKTLLIGAVYSLIVASIAWVMGIVLGIIGASLKLNKNKFLRFLGNCYVELIRGTPMLLQILFFYLIMPTLITLITGNAFRVNKFVVGTIAIGINSGAYSTELIRSGIIGIDAGQWEAAMSLNLSHWDMMRYVILPQAFKQVVPPMVSEYITLIKDSSLLSTIGAVELLYSAQIMGANYYNYLFPLMMAGVFYLVMTVVISSIAKKVDRRLAESD